MFGRNDVRPEGRCEDLRRHEHHWQHWFDVGLSLHPDHRWTWKITGGGTVEMPYNPTELYRFTERGLVE